MFVICSLPALLFGQKPANDEVVQLSPFVVSTSNDRGYQASNAVSATRLNVPIKDVPIALTAFTEEFINDVNADLINEIVTYAPGVSKTNASFGGTRDMVNIRGFEQTSPLRNGFTGAGLIDPAVIARVEVSRGPSSVLYGSLAPGGVINYITKRPKAERGGDISVSVGSYERLGAELDVWGSLNESKTLRYRLVTVGETSKDIYPNYKQERTLVFPVLQWVPNADWSITVDYERSNTVEHATPLLRPQVRPRNFTPSVNAGWYFYPGLPRNFSYSSATDLRDQENTVVSAEVLGKIAGWNVRGFFNYNHRDVWFGSTGTSDVQNNLPADASFNYLGRRGRLERNDARGKSYQVETSKEFVFGRNELKLLVGALYSTGTGSASQANRPGGLNPPKWDLRDPSTWDNNVYVRAQDLVLSSWSGSGSDTRAAYVTAVASFFDRRLTVLGGYRTNELESDSTNKLTGVKTVNPSVSKDSPQVGALVKLNNNLGLFASYSTSFSGQPGTKLIRNVPSGPIEPVEGKGYDLGIKFDFMDGRISGNLGVFQATNDNFATNIFELDPVTSATFQTTVTGRTMESKGTEFEVTYVPSENVQLYFSYAYLDAYIEKSILANYPVGTPLSFAPEHSAHFLGKYSFSEGSLKGFSVGAGVQAISDQFYSEEIGSSVVPFRLDGYALADVFGSYSWNRGAKHRSTVSLQVKNVFDTYYDPSFFNRYQPRRVLLTYKTTF
jgi:iron complex outermembrane receptor protein